MYSSSKTTKKDTYGSAACNVRGLPVDSGPWSGFEHCLSRALCLEWSFAGESQKVVSFEVSIPALSSETTSFRWAAGQPNSGTNKKRSDAPSGLWRFDSWMARIRVRAPSRLAWVRTLSFLGSCGEIGGGAPEQKGEASRFAMHRLGWFFCNMGM